MKTIKPNPGSLEAIEKGCTCPVIDNGNGKGSGWLGTDGMPMFWYSGKCPMHGIKEIEEK